MLNLFLLFHKCGNNYVKAVHRHDRIVRFVESIQPAEADRMPEHDHPGVAVNVRCRNFGLDTLERNDLLSIPDARFLVFTRHPASFVLSAVKYHLAGVEEWAVKKPDPLFGGLPFTQALRGAQDDAEREIMAMMRFRSLYERQASFAKTFEDERFMRVRCEDLFANAEPGYFLEIANFLRLGDRTRFVRALQKASPANMKTLPDHSTGAFKKRDPYAALAPRAKDYYDEHFSGFARQLGY